MNLLEELNAIGINTDAGLKHFKGNAAIFERFLKKFPASVNGLEVQPLLEQGDIKQAYEKAHALKGICANLFLTSLYDLYAKISDTLKAGSTEGVEELLKQAQPLQEKIIKTIESV